MTIHTDPVDPGDLVRISVVLPASLALEVEEAILRILERHGSSPTWSPTREMHSDVADAWDMPAWHDTNDDRLRMSWLVGDLDPKHIDVLARIHNEPGTPTAQLLAAAGYPPGTKASGVFRAISNRFRKVNRRPLWHGGEQTPEGQALRSPGPLGDLVGIRLFAEAVEQLEDDLDGDVSAAPGEDWGAVIASIKLTDANVALIEAFRSFPGHAATAGMIADRLGHDAYGAANLAIGALGKRIAAARAAIDPAHAPKTRSDGSPMWWHEVADGEIRDDGLFWWTLRPDLDAALRRGGV